ncbi:hypothetical protein CRUP_027308, partial [Coryphaenoides rupestris]
NLAVSIITEKPLNCQSNHRVITTTTTTIIIMSQHFRSGPAFGLSAEVKSKLAGKYDPQKEEELRLWIQDVTGKRVGEPFMESLKDGVILCELINTLQPGSLENIGNFVRAITSYGLKLHDLFEANDLFENVNHTQVQSTLITLAGMVIQGFHSKYDMGVKYAEKQHRRFAPEKLKEGRNVIGLQPEGMTSYGTRRLLFDSKIAMDAIDQSTISLQMGHQQGANQAGMTAPGTRRLIFDKKLDLESCDTSTVSLQMGTNKVASQRGMTSYGQPRQVCDTKYCNNPTEEDPYNNQGAEFDGYNQLINTLQPGSLENIGNFVRAITSYGLKLHDLFEANDLFENVNHTQVQSTLITLAGMAKSKGFHSKYDMGVKYAEKQHRRFAPEKLKEGRNVIGLQMGTNKLASQKGMTSYGTRRLLFDSKIAMDAIDQSTISLQMGTNKGANQAGMTAPGTRRLIFDKKLDLESCDTSTVSLQMGTNKVASQRGMTSYGQPRQVCDTKYCNNPTEEDPYNNQGAEFDGYNQYSE